MRLLVVHPSLNRSGGAERVCLGTIKALSSRGHRVHLATVDRTDWSSLEERFGGIIQRPDSEEHLLDTMPFSGTLSQAAYTVMFFLPLVAYHRLAGDFDLILNTYGELEQSMADISYINAIPIRLAHLWAYADPQSIWMKALTSAFSLSSIASHKLLTNNILLTNSTFMRDIIRRHLLRESTVIFPPVELQRFRENAQGKEKENLVVTVTRLRQGKQLEIIPKVARHVRNCRFIILALSDAASGTTLDGLAKSIRTNGVENRVEILLNQPSNRIVEILTSSKVYLHTQSSEAFGISVVEAMVSGCVPVVPQSGGPWIDILNESEARYGFSFISPEEAGRKIDLLFSNDQLRKQVSDRARQRADAFDSALFESRLAGIVERVLQSRLNL